MCFEVLWGLVRRVKMIKSSYWTGHKHGPWGCSERTVNYFCTVRSMCALNGQMSSTLSLTFTDVKFSPGNIIFQHPLTQQWYLYRVQDFLSLSMRFVSSGKTSTEQNSQLKEKKSLKACWKGCKTVSTVVLHLDFSFSLWWKPVAQKEAENDDTGINCCTKLLKFNFGSPYHHHLGFLRSW